MDAAAEQRASQWSDACLAASLFAVDPNGTGGLWIIGRSGGIRDRLLEEMNGAMGRLRRIPAGVTVDRLIGGIDLAATLASGKPVREAGLIERGGTLLAPMAERIDPGSAALIGQGLDARNISLVALDERAEDDEALPNVLADRLGLVAMIDGLQMADCLDVMPDRDEVIVAQDRLTKVVMNEDRQKQIVATGMVLGTRLRASIHAVAAARASAALRGDDAVNDEDLANAVRLVLAPRATQMPQSETDEQSEAQQEPEDQTRDDNPGDNSKSSEASPQDMPVDVIKAALPPGLLTAMMAGQAVKAQGRVGAGAKTLSPLRGRPAGTRPGRPARGARLDVMATLRAAAPWQKMRGPAPGGGIAIRADDFRIKRLKERAETLTVFCVDASGSAAIARLAEAKGAVEVMLAEAYRRRDFIAVIAFRGERSELLLPPTRALARAKRLLAGLPGGGGTPLAAGLLESLTLAQSARRRGQTPMIVALTDGKANIALDGKPGSPKAAEDASAAGRAIRGAGIPSLLIDMARRPQSRAENLARDMGARYLTMPYSDAAGLGRAVRDAR